MKRTLKFLTLLFFVILAIPLFTACGKTPPPNNEDGGSNPPPATPAGLTYDFITEDEGGYYALVSIGDCTDKNIVIESSVFNKELNEHFPVKSILGEAFYQCTTVETVTIPNSIELIGNFSFKDCTNLTSINIPDSVETIGICAFEYCEKLTNITIGQSVRKIESSAFSNCTGLKTLTITSPTVSIEYGAFSGCSNLETIVGCEAITTIPEYAFCGCNKLQSFTFNNSITTIGNHAFSGCTTLESIEIPNSVNTIEVNAFYDCFELKYVSLGNSIKNIASNAFNYSAIFDYVGEWENNVYYLDNCLITANEDTSGVVTIKEGTKCIANNAFLYCSNKITEVIIPDSVKYIGEGAFLDCSELTNVEIGSGVIYIGEKAFKDCDKLETVVFEITETWKVNNVDIDKGSLSNSESAADQLLILNADHAWKRV